MTEIIVLDIGDVLVRTHPDAHYRTLAMILGTTWEEVRETVESCDLVARFEQGHISQAQFTEELRELLEHPKLTAHEVATAWCAVLGPIDPVVAAPARLLASAGRLLLASNTNPIHWRHIRLALEHAGITAPALLSHELGFTKPDPRFFAALTRLIPHGTRCGLFVDDRAENIAAAHAAGLPASRHIDADASARRLAAFAPDTPAPERI